MKPKHIYFVLIIILCSFSCAYAKVDVSDSVDTRTTTVSGYMNGYEETNIISMDIQDSAGNIVYTSYIPTDDGNFDYSFKLPDATEQYKFVFHAYSTTEDIPYNSISTSDANTILDSINGIAIDDNSNADENSVLTIVENNKNVILLNPYFWNECFNSAQKNSFAKAILQNRGSGYTSFDVMRSVARKEYAILSFSICKTSNLVGLALDEFDEIYDIKNNISRIEDFNKFTDLQKNVLNNVISNEIKNTTNINTLQNVYAVIDRSVLLALINNAKDPLTIKELIENGRGDITFSLNTFDSSNKDVVCLYLFGKEIYSMLDLKSMIDKAVEGINTQQEMPNPGGNTGGGGGNGGASASASNITQYPSMQKPSPITSFKDMGNSLWAVDAVNYLANKKIISGVGDNNFAPNDNVTREQFVQMIVKAFAFENSGVTSFADISEDHWSYSAISTAVSNNIISGIGDSLFGLGHFITRQDMAVIIFRAVNAKGYSLNSKNVLDFNDASDIAEYAKESIKVLSEAGIVNGLGDGNFAPNGVATRAQAAQIIFAILQEVE
jgi:hypothetical protein